MKSKLNPIIILVALFIFKIGVIDPYRLKHTEINDTSNVPLSQTRTAAVR